jgi:hypothetical protein
MLHVDRVSSAALMAVTIGNTYRTHYQLTTQRRYG